MLKGIRGSSILFSHEFDKQESFYLKSDFVNYLYEYCRLGGFYTILSSEITTLLIYTSTFIGFLFLTNCIKYNALLELDNNGETESFLKIIDFTNITHLDYPYIILIILFCLFFLFKIFTIIDQTKIFYKIKYFLQDKIKLRDSELRHLTWEEIVHKIKDVYNDPQINVYLLSSRITIGDNILLSMFDKNLIPFTRITNMMETSLKFCFISPFLTNERVISYDSLEDIVQIENKIRIRLKILSILQFLFMPLIVLCNVFYNVVSLAEKIYHNPVGLLRYQWTRYAKWKWRAYNELEDDYNIRIQSITELGEDYTKQFSNPFVRIFLQFTYHILNLAFVFFILISFLNQNSLLTLVVVGDRSVLWFLGILGSLLSISRSFTTITVPRKSVRKCMNNILESLKYVDDDWITHAHKRTQYNKFLKYFNYKLSILLYNSLYTLITPFYLWKLQYETENIVYFLRNSFIKHPVLGYISKYAVFENDSFSFSGDAKTAVSLETFKQKYEKTSILLNIV